MTHRNLAAYTRWILGQTVGGLVLPRVPLSVVELANGLREGSGVTALVLHRDGQFQTELFLMHPGAASSVPMHRHPHVDSMEYFLTGGVQFTKNNRTDASLPRTPPWAAPLLSVRARDWHAAAVEPEGAAFLSIQRWHEGFAPSSVTLDWIGPEHRTHTMSGEHG